MIAIDLTIVTPPSWIAGMNPAGLMERNSVSFPTPAGRSTRAAQRQRGSNRRLSERAEVALLRPQNHRIIMAQTEIVRVDTAAREAQGGSAQSTQRGQCCEAPQKPDQCRSDGIQFPRERFPLRFPLVSGPGPPQNRLRHPPPIKLPRLNQGLVPEFRRSLRVAYLLERLNEFRDR